jgi:hypothetical protein
MEQYTINEMSHARTERGLPRFACQSAACSSENQLDDADADADADADGEAEDGNEHKDDGVVGEAEESGDEDDDNGVDGEAEDGDEDDDDDEEDGLVQDLVMEL